MFTLSIIDAIITVSYLNSSISPMSYIMIRLPG